MTGPTDRLQKYGKDLGGEFEYLTGVRAAFDEAVRSNLPGLENGPADAYRPVLGLAELTRVLGERDARRIGEDHERKDPHADPRATAMDLHNNEIGIAIGRRARTWEDVRRLARQAISEAPKDGNGGPGVPVWMPPATWRGSRRRPNWPDIDWRHGVEPGEEASPSLSGALFRHWTPPSASTMELEGRHAAREAEIVYRYAGPDNDGRPSPEFGGRLRNPALDRWLAERRAPDRIDGGGTVHVSAHTRVRDGRPVPVDAHTRAPPSHRR